MAAQLFGRACRSASKRRTDQVSRLAFQTVYVSRVRHMSSMETLSVSRPRPHVVQVQLNRPEKSNAMNRAFLREFGDVFSDLSKDADCRAIVLAGAGKNFCAGLDLGEAAGMLMVEGGDGARKARRVLEFIQYFQRSLASVETCPQPVIAAVHGACIGGGVDLISACDMRYSSQSAVYQIKEVDLGLVADVGSLQRLPKITGNESLLRELAYSARKFSAEEALQLGLVSSLCESQAEVVEKAVEMAGLIASKSPVAVYGTKKNLNFSRDHSVQDGMLYAATWNMAMLQTEDVVKAVQSMVSREEAEFENL